jgi:Icc-related predicted phosphoesterase
MRILIFSDIHNDLAALRRLIGTEADYYVAAGDLVSWGRGLDACGEALRAKAGKVWVMPGNHESAEQIASFCGKFGFRNFHDQSIEAGGWQFAGLGYSSPTPFNTPGEYTEEQLAERLRAFAGVDRLVLICHAPPYGTPLDRVKEGLHAGSRAVREFIEANQPEYFFCGHIHEAEGRETKLGKTVAVNVGKRGYLLEM